MCADLAVKANPKKIRVPQKESLVKQENDVDLSKVNKIKGWMLMTAGVVCFMVPGLPGIPLLLMGASALWPENGGQKKVKG